MTVKLERKIKNFQNQTITIGVHHETSKNFSIYGRIINSCCYVDKLLLRPRSLLPTTMQTSLLSKTCLLSTASLLPTTMQTSLPSSLPSTVPTTVRSCVPILIANGYFMQEGLPLPASGHQETEN